MTKQLATKRSIETATDRSNAFKGKTEQVEWLMEPGTSKEHFHPLTCAERTFQIGGYVFRQGELPDATDFNRPDLIDRNLAQELSRIKKGYRQ
jgi:hypothetical protein